jgi:hypothetical protein
VEAKSYRLVYVEWEDSLMGNSGWGETEAARPSVVTVQSVGWLIHDGKDCKLVVPHLSEAGHSNAKQQGCGDMTIPASSITRLVNLNLPRVKRR